jgi:PhnB protein
MPHSRTPSAQGATVLRPVEDKLYGDRGGEFEDPFGHQWSIASHTEDLTPEEMEQRMGQMPG